MESAVKVDKRHSKRQCRHLIDIYLNNPDLQRVGEMTRKKYKVIRRTRVPLPPVSRKISRFHLRRRLKIEKTALENYEKVQRLKPKVPKKIHSPYSQSGFDIVTNLANMHITEKTAKPDSSTVSEKSGEIQINQDTETEHHSTEGTSEGKDKEISFRSERIQGLFQRIQESRRHENWAALKPLRRIILEMDSTEDPGSVQSLWSATTSQIWKVKQLKARSKHSA